MDKDKKYREYRSYSRNSEALDYKQDRKKTELQKISKNKKRYTHKKKKNNLEKSTFLDKKTNTKPKSKYAKKNLKYDTASVAKRREKLILDSSLDVTKLTHKELKKKLILLNDLKVTKIQKHSAENVVIVDGNTKKFKLSIINCICILGLLASILFFIDSNSRILDARESYEKANSILRETQTNRDNLVLKTSTLSNDEEYKMIARNKLGMDYPEKHQKIMVPMEKVNYSEIYVSENTKESPKEGIFDFLSNLWR